MLNVAVKFIVLRSALSHNLDYIFAAVKEFFIYFERVNI